MPGMKPPFASAATESTATQEVPLHVLVVCPRGQTLQDVRALIGQWPVPAHVRWTSDPVEALRLALAQRPALVLVDARLDRAGGRALIAQLLRSNNQLDVFAFDEPHLPGLRARPSLWHWSELPRVLRWWVQRHLCQAPLFDSLPGGLGRAQTGLGQSA